MSERWGSISARALAAAAQRVAELEEMLAEQWTKTSDRRPRVGQHVLTWSPVPELEPHDDPMECCPPTIMRRMQNEDWKDEQGIEFIPPTYWREIPTVIGLPDE